MRKRLKSLIDKKGYLEKSEETEFDVERVQNQISAADKKVKDLQDHLQREEDKLRQSLRAKLDLPVEKAPVQVDEDSDDCVDET